MSDRSYTELLQLPTYEERYRYLCCGGRVGEETFGHERFLNQRFYTSHEWRTLRQYVIARDYARDLGVPGFDILPPAKVFVHHMNPIRPDDIVERNPLISDPEFLITVTHRTHNAIHYGDRQHAPRGLTVRTPHDTSPWRQ